MVNKKLGKYVIFFSQNHTEINSDDWTITKKTTRTIKHENFSKMKILKVDRWALSLNSVKYWFILPTSEVLLFLAIPWTGAASIMRPLSRGRPRDNSAVHGASEDVPGMTYDVPGVSYPIPWTSGDCPQGVRPADGPGTHSLASTGPFSQAAVHRASGLLRFSQSQRGRIMDRKWGCPQYVRNRKLMSRSCPGNATATLLAALTFFVKNKLILL